MQAITRRSLTLLALLSAPVSTWALSWPEYLSWSYYSDAFEDDYKEVEVKEAFLNLHTHAGRGFPIFYIAEKGEAIEIIHSHTDWYRIRTPRGVEGWAHKDTLTKTLDVDAGELLSFESLGRQDYHRRRFELGLGIGALEQNEALRIRAAYRINDIYSAEFSYSESSGSLSSSHAYNFNVVYHPWVIKNFEPSISFGAGRFENNPKPTLVATEDTDSMSTNFNLGLAYYLSQRFVARLDYRNYFVYISDDETDSYQEWTASMSFFVGSHATSLFERAFDTDINANDFEIQYFRGGYSLEDFGSHQVRGLRLSYHISEDYFVETSFAQTRMTDDSFRDSGLTLFGNDNEEDFSYYNFSAGINILPGEIVFTPKYHIKTQVYLVAGAGNTQFFDQDYFTIHFGGGLRVFPFERVAVHVDYRSHLFDLDLLGSERATQNAEITGGISWYF